MDPAARPVREKMPGIGFGKLATNMGRKKSPAKILGSDVIVAKLKNERACFVPRMQIHLFPHGVGNRRISSHEGVSNPFRGSANSVADADCVGPQWLAAVGGRGVVGRGEGAVRGGGEEVTYPHKLLQ